MPRKPITAKLRYLILERDGFACQCCGVKAPNVTLQVDHIIAQSKGGSDEPSNLRAVCITCNVGKSDMDSTVVPLPSAVNYPVRVSDKEVKINNFCGEPLHEPIFWIGEQWAVTAYGIEARDGTYAIAAKDLWQDEPDYSWYRHMREKEWVNMADFGAALEWARAHFADLKPKHLRSA